MDSEERIHLKPISEKEFREIAKGCGRRAAIESGLSNSSIIKYAIDHGRSYVKRRSEKKKFYVREI